MVRVSGLFVAWACCVIAAASACSPESGRGGGDDDDARSENGAPRRIVLVVIDTLRADHLEVYGYEHRTAPFLASLAKRGVVFDRAHSTSSWTAPSTASIVTGLYPTRHGVVEGFFAHRQRESFAERDGVAVQPLTRLPGDARLMAERLRDAGYATLGVASNINIGPVLGFDRGFDRFVHAQQRPAEGLLQEAAAWPELQPDSGERSFLYLHLNDAHVPYDPRRPWFEPPSMPGRRPMAAYDSEISYIDAALERLATELAWDDETLVIVVSDHGEEFGDHGGTQHAGGLHEELTHVVMIFAGAGLPARRVGVDVSLVDVLPTLLDLAGLEADPALDGRSLAPLLRGGDADPEATAALEERALLAHRAKMGRDHGAHWWAVIHDGWKLIVDGDDRALYDQRTDRREQHDLAKSEPERVRALEARLEALRGAGLADAAARQSDRTEIELDEAMVEALEALGYTEGGDEGDGDEGDDRGAGGRAPEPSGDGAADAR